VSRARRVSPKVNQYQAATVYVHKPPRVVEKRIKRKK